MLALVTTSPNSRRSPTHLPFHLRRAAARNPPFVYRSIRARAQLIYQELGGGCRLGEGIAPQVLKDIIVLLTTGGGQGTGAPNVAETLPLTALLPTILMAVQRTQITFLPVTKLTKATTAAEFSTTNVRAASATRASGPILNPTMAAKLRP